MKMLYITRHLSLLLLVSIILVSPSFAQDVTIENVSPNIRKYQGVKPVEDLGYYCFVQDEKTTKGMKNFNLHVWDYDLKEVVKTSLELEKKSLILGSVYNGANFLVSFYDRKTKKVNMVSFDSKGDEAGKASLDGIKAAYMELEDFQPSFYAGDKNSFYTVVPNKEKKFGFSVSKFNNSLEQEWSKDYFPEKGVQVVLDAKANDDQIVILKYSKASKFTKTTTIDMTAFDGSTGEESWTYDLNIDGNTMMPTELALPDNGNIAVAGIYFEGEKVKSINSDGMFFAYIDANGKEIALTQKSWEGDLQKFIKESKNSMTLGKPKVIFEDIIFNESNNTFKVIGEIYTVGTAGKVLAMMSGDSDAETKVTIEDLIVFTFDTKGEMKDLFAINKARTNLYVPMSYSGGVALSFYLKQMGGLPYKYSSLDENGDAIAFYTDFVKMDENGELVNQKIGLGAKRIGVGMLNLDKSTLDEAQVKYLPLSKKAANQDEKSDVEFDSKRSIIGIAESKPGYILISDFSKKTENLNLFLEKIN